jgi:hypothetical protein
MTALSAGRITSQIPSGKLGSAPVKASTVIYAGSLVARDASGYAVPASASAALTVVGRACSNSGLDRWDNGSGSNGDITVLYEEGIYGFANSSSPDAIVDADVGKSCWAVDDQTVAKTSGGGARPAAGRIVRVESSVVYVDVAESISRQVDSAVKIIEIPVKLAKHTNSSVAARFTPGYAGRIRKLTFSVTDPATTASKAATFTPYVAGVTTTGGAVALTSANCTPVGAKVNGSALTATDMEFGATDELTIVASSVTAFVEGEGVFYLHLEA